MPEAVRRRIKLNNMSWFSKDDDDFLVNGIYDDPGTYDRIYIGTRNVDDDRYEAIIDKDEMDNISTLHANPILSGGKVDLTD